MGDREDLTIEKRYGRSRGARKDLIVPAKKAQAVRVEAREKPAAFAEAVVDDNRRHRIRAGRRRLGGKGHLHVREERVTRVRGAIASEFAKHLVGAELEHRFRVVAVLEAVDGGERFGSDSEARVE